MQLQRLKPTNPRLASSWAVQAGDVIYVAGMVGMTNDLANPSDTDLVFPDGVEAQMRQAYRNIEWILHQVGAELTDIAQQTIFFTGDGGEVVAANRVVRSEVFGAMTPASAMVGANTLFDPRCRLEIQAIAYRGYGRSEPP